MKTAITITTLRQTGMDSCMDVRLTKIFPDEATLLDIKAWIHSIHKSKIDVSEISLADAEISDVDTSLNKP